MAVLSGQTDLVDRVATSDLAQVRADKRVKLLTATSLGYYNIALNTNAGEAAGKPFAQNPKLREALPGCKIEYD